MKLSLHRKVLLSMGVVAGIGALAGAGTFATFTAQTSNPTNTFADGTLVLSNKVGSGTANLTLQNKGSLPASALKVFSNACTDADASGENYHGTGSPCGVVQLYVQQYSDSGFSTPSHCLYGGSPDSGVTCDFSDAAKTLTAFVTAYPNFGGGLSAGSLAAAGGADTTWIKVGVMLPSTAGNSYQGRSASLAFNWQITQ